MKRAKRLLRIVAINYFILAVAIVWIELIFGGWIGDTNNLRRLNLIIDRTININVSKIYADPNPIIQYSRDNYGLRGAYGKPENIDILTIGGSTTDQRFIRDGETWQDILQACLTTSGTSMVIANAGVDGQSTYGHVLDFKWWFPLVPGLRPKYVLFYVGINDFYKEAGYSFDKLINNDQKSDLKDEIKSKSALYDLYRIIRGAYLATIVHKISHRKVDFDKINWTSNPIQNNYDFMNQRLKEYADRLRILADMTRDLGATPIFVSQPSRKYRITPDGIIGDGRTLSYDGHEYNGLDHYHMLRKLDGVTKAVAIEKNALFVDLGGYRGWTNTDFYDFYHMTPQGVKKVGILMCKALK